jgi:cytidine deaminase
MDKILLPPTQLAWLRTQGGALLFAETKSAEDVFAINFAKNPVVQLINGINIEFGVERFRHLRNTINTNYPLFEWEKNLIKVCAKRHSDKTSFELDKSSANRILQIGRPLTLGDEAIILNDAKTKTTQIAEALKLAYEAAKKMESSQIDRHRFNRDRHVVAILLDQDGRLLMAARNTNHNNQVLHAEVNLLLAYSSQFQNKIPKGASLVCSLKPCRMCASLFLDLCQDPATVRVFAAEDDLGRFGRHKLLGSLLTIGFTSE